tara:strand:- start:1206 stop:1562 length:357 start_codon:yes stop_codon:yes gene_type:complete
MSHKLVQSLKKVATLRLKIFQEEVKLEKMRLIRAAIAAAAGFALLQTSLGAVLILGVELTEGSGRIWFLSVLGSLTFVGGVVAFLISKRLFSSREAPFAMTAREFQKDIECLQSVIKS